MKVVLRILITFFIILLLAGMIGLVIIWKMDKPIEYNNVTIQPRDYAAIKNVFTDSRVVRVCNMDSGKCIDLIKMGGESET